MIHTVDTRNMTHEQWLKERRKAIGGSDAAAIVGLSAYASPFTVWLDKLGKSEPKPDTEAMRIGRDLEEYVAQRFTEATGKKVRRKNAIIYNSMYPFAHANIDREIVGENAILECKTTSILNLKKFKGGEYPANYYVQVMHYMAVTGAQKAYISVLVLGEGFYWYEVERDQNEINALMEAEQELWEHVVQQTEPPVLGLDCDAKALFGLHPRSNGLAVDLFGHAKQMSRYLEIKAEIKKLEAQADEIANAIKQALGDNEHGTDGEFTASWKMQTRSNFDRKAFAAANPDIDLSPYFKTSTCRVFTVK